MTSQALARNDVAARHSSQASFASHTHAHTHTSHTTSPCKRQ